MVKLDEIMDTELLADMLAEGYVRRSDHPTLPLHIYNYTAKAQYDQRWNDATEQARGLIVTSEGDVAARPFRKFHNYSQVSHTLPHFQRISVYEKLDGSLGVLYPTVSGHYAIATRGSFTSDQAVKATAILKARYDQFVPREGVTYLFEILYPANRIVVDYGDLEDIILLDAIHIESGESVLDEVFGTWPGKVVGQHEVGSIAELLTLPQETNREGYVVRFEDGTRVKIKHDEYVRLHRVLTNVTARRLFEIAVRDDLLAKDYTPKQIAYVIGMDISEVEGIPKFQDILDRVPDEFYAWVKEVEERLEMQYREIAVASMFDFEEATKFARANTLVDQDERHYRKQFALRANQSEYSDILFKLMHDEDVSGIIWKRIRPLHEKPFFQQSEDVA